jgi:hypothetical protein
MLTALITGCNSSSDSSNNSTKSSGPTVIATNPGGTEKAVPLSHKVIATFSEAMDSTTIDKSSFSVKNAAGVALSGDFNVDAASHTASFTPVAPGFAVTTEYTATLTTAIKTKADSTPLANNYEWQFTSSTAADAVAPIVDSTTPANGVTDVLLNRVVTANFSEALDPATVNASTFTLVDSNDDKVSGDVSYSNKVATFNPSNNLASNTTYTVTLTTEITDLADIALAAKTWSFDTGTTIAKGPKPVDLRTAGDFTILTKAGITNTGAHASAITGNIGASPITAAAMDNVFCSEITGTIYGADAGYTGSGAIDCFKGAPADNTLVANAVLDMGTAYADASGRTDPDFTELHAGDISGETLVPGLYKWGTNVLINTSVTLSGGANDVWIFQISGDVIQASDTQVILEGGALAKNVFWQVGGGTGVALNTGADFNGIVLAEKGISVNTNAAVNGRLLSHTAVTLDMNAITAK